MAHPSALQLDHIAVVAPSLASGVEHVERALGVPLAEGGSHPAMGTHNCVLHLGDNLYLEVIAADPKASPPERPRWFGLDGLGNTPPYLATWLVRTPDLDASVNEALVNLGPPIPMSRGDLHWRITVPNDGTLPLEGAHPTFIEWPAGQHPTSRMPDRGCRLVQLTVNHPNAAAIRKSLGDRFRDSRVELHEADHIGLAARIETPDGLHTLC